MSRFKSKLASSQGVDIAAQAVEVNGAKVLAAAIDGADAKTLRDTLDQLKGRFKSAAIVLGSTDGPKVTLIAGVTSDLTGRIKAGDLVNHVATQVGGKGGGRPDMAQAGGTMPEKLPAALASVRTGSSSVCSLQWPDAATVIALADIAPQQAPNLPTNALTVCSVTNTSDQTSLRGIALKHMIAPNLRMMRHAPPPGIPESKRSGRKDDEQEYRVTWLAWPPAQRCSLVPRWCRRRA